MFEVLCQEKEGAIWRTIRLMKPTISGMLDVVSKMQQVPNFLEKDNPYQVFTDSNNTFFLVDEVGIIAVVASKPGLLHCHITFWDGRLRGREKLCKALAVFVEATTKLPLVTAIPADRRAVIAFAKRAGFEEGYNNDGVVILNFTNYPE